MPPKGLKAAGKIKRTATAAFDPSSVGIGSSSTAPVAGSASGSGDVSTSTQDGDVRTMPLDGDRLSVSDLFELRSSAVALLSSGDEDKMEEARGLLRGILHGVQDLLPLVPKHHSSQAQEGQVEGIGKGKASNEDQAGEEDSEKVELTNDQLRALGLVDKEQQTIALEAEPQLYYLQAWALHHYALVLPAGKTFAQAKLLSEETGKRRKLDPSESRDPGEWLALASQKYEEALRWHADSGNDFDLSHLLVLADGNRCSADRTAFLMSKQEEEAARQLMESGVGDLLPLITRIKFDGQHTQEIEMFFEERGDLIAVILRSIASVIASQEEVASLAQLAHSEKVCSALDTALEPINNGNGSWITAETALQWRFDLAIIRGDIALAQFGVEIEIVEDKYRPDATEDDEGDVEPLPVDAKEVNEAQRRGEEAIAKLRGTIELYSGLPAKKQIATVKTEQYRKLEEAHLMYSALFNPDDEKKAQEIEAELSKIRAEGGLDQTS